MVGWRHVHRLGACAGKNHGEAAFSQSTREIFVVLLSSSIVVFLPLLLSCICIITRKRAYHDCRVRCCLYDILHSLAMAVHESINLVPVGLAIPCRSLPCISPAARSEPTSTTPPPDLPCIPNAPFKHHLSLKSGLLILVRLRSTTTLSPSSY